MWSEVVIIMLVLWAYGFWNYRHYLKRWFKDFKWQMEMAWNGGKNGK